MHLVVRLQDNGVQAVLVTALALGQIMQGMRRVNSLEQDTLPAAGRQL
jgi:hypothetical protein